MTAVAIRVMYYDAIGSCTVPLDLTALHIHVKCLSLLGSIQYNA